MKNIFIGRKTSCYSVGAGYALAMMLFVGCFSSPDISSISCKDNDSCPSGYVCEIPGVPGGCKLASSQDAKSNDVVTSYEDSGSSEEASSYDGASSTDAVSHIDGAQSIDGVLRLDSGGDGIPSDLVQDSSGGVDSSQDTPLETGNDRDTGSLSLRDSASETAIVPDTAPDVPIGPDAPLSLGDAPGLGGTGGSTGTGSGGALGTGSVTSTGGAGSGGTPGTGGVTSTGGVSAGGTSSTGGTDASVANPPGYWMTKDWNVTSVDWHGCVWTAVDTVSGSTTSISPQDFTSTVSEGGPYEVSGTVFNSYDSVVQLGFNLNEAATSSSTQCKYNAAAAISDGPPTVTIPSSATGIAIGWSAKTLPTSFRIQIKGVDGATNAAHRWCANITDASGPSFVRFSDFNTKCWDNSGSTYNKEAIDAVVFLVPGIVAQKALFDFTINGFAPGTSASDAPGSSTCGTTSGTLGSTTASEAASMQRSKVSGTDCKQYIIQNNNWGDPTDSTQVIDYTGNSFSVASSSGSGSSAPASFPSIYIGANGSIANGSYSTWSDSGLPKQIGAMSSVQTSFAWSGGTGSKNFNATYDVWFSRTAPTAGGYNDAISGSIMVWLYKPSSRQPIGTVKRTVTIANHTWNVWIGPRGNTSTGTDDAGRPVISYVAQDSPVSTLSFDLKNFIDDAVTNANSDMSAGGTSQAFSNSWYLTDVFGGFEIWTGSDASNLACSKFTCVVE